MISERGPNNAIPMQTRQASSPQSKPELSLSLLQAHATASDAGEPGQASDGQNSARQHLQSTFTGKKQPSNSTQRAAPEGKGRLTKTIQTNIELYFKRDSAKAKNLKQPLKQPGSPSKPARPTPGGSGSRGLLGSSLIQLHDSVAPFGQPREAASVLEPQTCRAKFGDGRSVSR